MDGKGSDSVAKIIAVCRSREKGTKKSPIAEGVLMEDYGLIGDAHASGGTHRQVSLLAIESINKIRSLGVNVGTRDFAENLTNEGIGLSSLPIGTNLSIKKEVILKVTQIGKKDHSSCDICHQVG